MSLSPDDFQSGPMPTHEHVGRIVRVVRGARSVGEVTGYCDGPSVTLRTVEGHEIHRPSAQCEVLSVEAERDWWRARAKALDPLEAPTLAEAVCRDAEVERKKRLAEADLRRAEKALPTSAERMADEGERMAQERVASTLRDRLASWAGRPAMPEKLRADLRLMIAVLEDLADGGFGRDWTSRVHRGRKTQVEFTDAAGVVHVLARQTP